MPSEAIFSKSIKASGKTYFFDVKQAQGGKQSKFIQVTETRLRDGHPVRSSINIFSDQVDAFREAFDEVREKAN